MQFPHECFVIALSHRTTKNITTDDFAGVNLDGGIVHGWANFKNAKTFLTEIEAKHFFEENKIYLMRKLSWVETYNPRIVRVNFTEDCKTKLE